VLAAVKALEYHPNQHARSLASRNSRTLGMVVSDIENPTFSALIKSFEARALRHGYEVIVSNTNYRPRLMKLALERMLQLRVRGVAILTSEMKPSTLQEILRREVPLVVFDINPGARLVADLKLDYVSGIRQAVEYLYNLGHRRIGFVTGMSSGGIKAREMAYTECMRSMGLQPGPILRGNQRLDGGMAAGEAIAKMSRRPTAVIAMNDLTAVGVCRALHQNGLSAPRDISIVGFDNTYLARCFMPSLTTVDVHAGLLGRLAADALHELTSTKGPKSKEYTIPLNLVVGESTGPPPVLEPPVEDVRQSSLQGIIADH
jgi:LacI family transcriptional regulator